MDDTETIKKCLAGKNERFGYLVKKYQKEAIGHAAAILGDIDDAQDTVQ